MTNPRARPLSTPPDYGALMLETPADAGYRMPAEWERHTCADVLAQSRRPMGRRARGGPKLLMRLLHAPFGALSP